MTEIQMARYEDFAEASNTVFVDIDHPIKPGEKVRIEVQSLPPGDLYAIAGAALTRRMQQDAKDPNDDEERMAYLQSLDDAAHQALYREEKTIEAMQSVICTAVSTLRLSTLRPSECPSGVVSVIQIKKEDQWAIYNACHNISVVSAEDRFPSDIAAGEDAGGSSGVSEPPTNEQRKREVSQ